MRVKRYSPDFFARKGAENPNGPMREATGRNKAVFPNDWKL